MKRRNLLRGSVGLAGLGLAGALTGCRTDPDDGGNSAGPGGSGDGSSVLPTYQARPMVDIAFPATESGIIAAATAYPPQSDWQRAAEEGVGGGTEVEVFGPAPGGTAPPPPERSAYYQNLKEKMGALLRVQYVPAASDRETKFAALVASGDIPDLCIILKVNRITELLEAQYEDLTPYLTGDAVLDYPNLANIPPLAWRETVYNGKIYGIPRFDGVVAQGLMFRTDNVDTDMTAADVTSGETFLELCREVTSPRDNRWAITQPQRWVEFVAMCMGGVNVWQETDTGFVHHYQTEQIKEALAVVHQMHQDGLIHPDAYGSGSGGFRLLPLGQVSLHWNQFAQWWGLLRNNLPTIPGFSIDGIVPPTWDGGATASMFLGRGLRIAMGMKKADPERIQTLLRIQDWLASPFGSAEYVDVTRGVEGVHYDFDGEQFHKLEVADNDTTRVEIAASPEVIFDAGVPAREVEKIYRYQATVAETGIHDASIGNYSETLLAKGQSLDAEMIGIQDDIITGRASVSDWDAAVTRWRSQGGDKIADELAASAAS